MNEDDELGIVEVVIIIAVIGFVKGGKELLL